MSQPPSPELIVACEAFSLGDAKPALPLVADQVRWRIVNDRLITGKAEFAAFCEELLEQGLPQLTKSRVALSDGLVVIEGRTADGDMHFCDLFDLADGRIVGITSYVICQLPDAAGADDVTPSTEPSA